MELFSRTVVLQRAQLKEGLAHTQKASSTDLLPCGKKTPAMGEVPPNGQQHEQLLKREILKLPFSSQKVWGPRNVCVHGVDYMVSSLQTLPGVSICPFLPLVPMFCLSCQMNVRNFA